LFFTLLQKQLITNNEQLLRFGFSQSRSFVF